MSTKTLDTALSAQLAKTVRAPSKECWLNAFRAMHERPGLRYVEGWCVLNGLLVEHGWLETDTAIVDPTLYRHPPARYFAGLVFTPAAASSTLQVLGTGELPIAWHMRQAPEFAPYKAAFDAALAYSIIGEG